MSEGDLSGMDSEVVEERVVAMEAVVASSKEGGVQGSSGRPEETSQVRSRQGGNAETTHVTGEAAQRKRILKISS